MDTIICISDSDGDFRESGFCDADWKDPSFDIGIKSELATILGVRLGAGDFAVDCLTESFIDQTEGSSGIGNGGVSRTIDGCVVDYRTGRVDLPEAALVNDGGPMGFSVVEFLGIDVTFINRIFGNIPNV